MQRGRACASATLQKAFELWKAAAEQGHLQAQVYLALCYFTGEGVKPDLAKAFSIWTAAADFGNRDAMRYLGILYANGTGVKKDTKRAMELLPPPQKGRQGGGVVLRAVAARLFRARAEIDKVGIFPAQNLPFEPQSILRFFLSPRGKCACRRKAKSQIV